MPGGDNSIQSYGEETSSSEREAAEKALGSYFGARERRNWAEACRFLSSDSIKEIKRTLEQVPQLKGSSCAKLLALFNQGLPAAALKSTLANGVAALRAEGDRGFALYHGGDGADYFVSMAHEDGVWKVAGLTATEIER